MRSAGALLDALTASFRVLGIVALALMMLHVNLDVLCRTFLNRPVPGTLEVVSHWYMVAAVFLPLALVERLNAHISVEIVSQHLRGRALAWLLAAASLLAGLYFTAMAWRTGIEALEKFEVREITQGQIALAVWPTRFFLPFGCGLLAFLLFWKCIRLMSGDLSVAQKPAGVDAELLH